MTKNHSDNGSQPKRIYRYTNWRRLKEILDTKSLILGDPERWDDQNDAKMFKAYGDRHQKRILALCFTTGVEKFHHWKIYSGSETGIRIEFDPNIISDLRNKISKYSGYVKYITFDDAKKGIEHINENYPNKFPFLIKRYGYSHEKEYRIVKMFDIKSETEIEIEISKKIEINLSCIKNITFAPWFDNSIKPCVEEYIKRIISGIEIKKTGIVDSKYWERLAEHV